MDDKVGLVRGGSQPRYSHQPWVFKYSFGLKAGRAAKFSTFSFLNECFLVNRACILFMSCLANYFILGKLLKKKKKKSDFLKHSFYGTRSPSCGVVEYCLQSLQT